MTSQTGSWVDRTATVREGAKMSRTRSEYRLRSLSDLSELSELSEPSDTTPIDVREPTEADRPALAALMLDAYRGTIDDEGEGEEEALSAIDFYLGACRREWSRVVERDDQLIAMCFVIDVEGVWYIDPIAVAASNKARGLGAELVLAVLTLLRESGISEVGAVITDGNEPSERLFSRRGFTRIGSWATP